MSEVVVSTGSEEVAVARASRGAGDGTARPRTLLICHEDAALDRDVLAGWLASFSDLVGVVVLRETGARMKRRVRRELKRVGALRFLDVLAFRVYYKFLLAAADHAWEERTARELSARFPVPPDVPVLTTHSPNSAEAAEFIRARRPDLMLARCKTLLKEEIFSLPTSGTFVMHPGVCPEYRNAHGCFWALANGDDARVGMTLLRIDKGVDTGPVYGYYTYAFDGARESHVRIQHRVVLENLDRLAAKLTDIHAERATSLDTRGRESSMWGQPWLSRYLRWKRRARRAGGGGRA
jgi:folate-dependent phosphoribosylglycinamide formyltransferase PurN